MITCIPELSVPLPSGAGLLDLHDRVAAALCTADYLDAFRPPDNLPLTDLDRVENRAALQQYAEGVQVPLPSSRAAILHLKSMLDAYDEMAVTSATQLRTYITNKLLEETNNSHASIRLKALELLGKIGDVGLFVERSVVTVQHKTSVELEQGIKERLARIHALRATADDPVTDVDSVMIG